LPKHKKAKAIREMKDRELDAEPVRFFAASIVPPIAAIIFALFCCPGLAPFRIVTLVFLAALRIGRFATSGNAVMVSVMMRTSYLFAGAMRKKLELSTSVVCKILGRRAVGDAVGDRSIPLASQVNPVSSALRDSHREPGLIDTAD
jgi:hypothetical protein